MTSTQEPTTDGPGATVGDSASGTHPSTHDGVDPAAIPGIVAGVRDAADSGRTRPLQWRRRQLDY